jgi:hypothetical protein
MIALARLSLRRPVLALLAWECHGRRPGTIGFGIEQPGRGRPTVPKRCARRVFSVEAAQVSVSP